MCKAWDKDRMISVNAHLDRPITVIGDAQADTFPTFIENDAFFLCNDSSGHFFCGIF